MKTAVIVGVVLAAFIAAGAVAYRALFAHGETERTWIVSTYSGAVEVSIGGASWQEAVIHQPLTDGDRLRTGAGGEVTMVHADSHVTMHASTQIEVSQLNSNASRFQLAEGEVYVESRGDRVNMRTRDGANMEAKDAGVGMLVRPDGWTQVKVKRGSVDFTAMDRTERVKEGEESHRSVGAPPSKAAAIPGVLLLNVRFPDRDTFTSRIAKIEGRSDPGTHVRVGDTVVDVGQDGNWSSEVTLNEGVNQIAVSASDSIGNQRTETSQPIRVDTTAPTLEAATIGSRRIHSP